MWVTIRTNAAVYNGKLGLKIKNRAGMLYSNTSRGIKKMTYNHIGQPSTVEFTDGGELRYTYSAAGELLGVSTYAVLAGKRRPVKVSERSYCGDFVFEGDSLAYVNFPGGYFDGNGGAHYRHPDFQGNITMVTDSDGKIEQHTGYYPYGEPWHEPAGQPYLYGGKERMRDGGLNDYDFSARRLNSALALWSTPDPLAFENTHSNPYVYCAGNPIRYVDPTGCDTISVNEDGYFSLLKPTDDDFDVIVGRDGATITTPKGFTNAIAEGDANLHSDDGTQTINTTYSLYDSKADEKKAKAIFEFLAENTNVEWSLVFSAGNNLIGTSHYANGECTIYYLDKYNHDLFNNISLFYHSHTDTGHASNSDRKAYRKLSKDGNYPVAKIYYVPNREYISYNGEESSMPTLVIPGPRIESPKVRALRKFIKKPVIPTTLK